MQPATVNHLNIGLMIFSAVVAIGLPYELFLFSYAVLGPLHYLTEISWLHDRKYFSSSRFDWLPLVGLSVLLMLGQANIMPEGWALDGLGMWGGDMVFIAFASALVFVLLPAWRHRVVGLAAVVGAAFLLHTDDVDLGNPYFTVFAFYVPTLIHVFVFTGAFILYGALKSRSGSGYVSLAVFAGCGAFVISGNGEMADYVVSEESRESYYRFFRGLHLAANEHFGDERLRTLEEFFYSPFSIKLVRFMAFAYTYHFLNWFSKTSVIRWHEVPRARWITIVVIWVASVGVYAWDFLLGFRWLYCLSVCHVFLEFPLNHQSFLGIGRELRARIRG